MPLDEKDPWIFCPSKRCYWCGRDISKDARLNGNWVTGCPFCNHSFVE